MIIDCHVHAVAAGPGRGALSGRMRRQFNTRLIRWHFGLPDPADAEAFDREAEAVLARTVDEAAELDAAVVLALDAVYDRDGRPRPDDTHLHVTNDHAAGLAERHPKLLFGCSVHPYRPDALAELERCIARGAVLLKWLPIVQDFNPADDRCRPLYEALAHHGLPLLSHTGGERALPNLDRSVADPELLLPALRQGVTVIAAHCGTRSMLFETDYLPAFVRLVKEHERLYGDTAMLNLPTRSYAYKTILGDPGVRAKLVHGSDWPLPPVPPLRAGWLKALRLLTTEGNWLRRDVLVKRALGFDDAYWHRAATLLRLPKRPA